LCPLRLEALDAALGVVTERVTERVTEMAKKWLRSSRPECTRLGGVN
jgi:hypothetical protein